MGMDDWLDTAFVKRVANNHFSDLNSETCKIAKKEYDLAQQKIQLVAEKKKAKRDTRREKMMRSRREMKERLKKATKSGATTKTKTTKKKTQNKKTKTMKKATKSGATT